MVYGWFEVLGLKFEVGLRKKIFKQRRKGAGFACQHAEVNVQHP
jgi:hypothetical protein